jgi:hypothetical protein
MVTTINIVTDKLSNKKVHRKKKNSVVTQEKIDNVITVCNKATL